MKSNGGSPLIRGVLFDLDGTLFDTWDLYIEAYIRTLEKYVGRRLSPAELLGLHPVSEIGLLRSVVGDSRLAGAHREFLAIYRTLHGELFGGIYPGVVEMLVELRRQRLAIGVVTGKSKAAWEVTSAVIALGRFDAVVTDDDVDQPKPHPDGIALALERLGLTPDEAVYVGDSPGDAKASRAAGVRFAAALWPKAPEEVEPFVRTVGEYGPWRIIRRPTELPDALSRVLKNSFA
ncbi:MAG TPA: HAD family hydrolase [Syntrophobacteria bacterium]|nr:HAD family hydrolase [Syntrophobacteria bacterium]